MSEPKPLLVVDKRQDYRFTAALEDYFAVQMKQLKTGDLLFSCGLGTVGIEDKVFSDLTGSRRNGRLDDELRRLVETYAVPILFVRGKIDEWNAKHDRWDETTIQNLLLGRQLYGLYTYRVREWPGVDPFDCAAEAVFRLYTYLHRPGASMQGVRREAKRAYTGPLGARAEVIYGILGLVQGIKGRRAIADRIARDVSVREFLSWSVSDFVASGFTTHMARKLTTVINQLEAKT